MKKMTKLFQMIKTTYNNLQKSQKKLNKTMILSKRHLSQNIQKTSKLKKTKLICQKRIKIIKKSPQLIKKKTKHLSAFSQHHLLRRSQRMTLLKIASKSLSLTKRLLIHQRRRKNLQLKKLKRKDQEN